jgi:hypothetical protein
LRAIKNKLSKVDLDSDGKTPVYSSESRNNGIIGYTRRIAEFVVTKDNPIYIVFGDHTRSFNIATSSFCVMDNTKVLSLNEINSIKIIQYVISAWKKCIPNQGYSRHWSIAKKVLFNLPINSKAEIDFNCIEDFINTLEAEHITILENYLLNKGFKDYTLTTIEQKTLENLKIQKFKEFNVIDIFDVKNTGNILSRDINPNSGKTPYLCASSENNGVSSYINYNEKFLDKGNCVFIGGKTFVVSYQKRDFYSNDSHNLALYPKNEEIRNKINQLYLATCINKSLGYKYSWGDSISNRKIQKDKVSLPIKNGKPDFSTMETLISAIQKLIIKDVVLYVEEKRNK